MKYYIFFYVGLLAAIGYGIAQFVAYINVNILAVL